MSQAAASFFERRLHGVWPIKSGVGPQHGLPHKRSQVEQQVKRLAQNAGELQCKHTRDRQEVCVVE